MVSGITGWNDISLCCFQSTVLMCVSTPSSMRWSFDWFMMDLDWFLLSGSLFDVR